MAHWANIILEDALTSNRAIPEHVEDGLKRIAKIVEVSDVVQFRTSEIEGIAEAISECEDLSELSQLLWQATISLGFQNFSLFVIDQGQYGTFPSRLCTSLKSEWLDTYFTKSYQYVDPVSLQASKADNSFLFTELKNSCPLIEEYWLDAEKHQIGRNGFCRSITRPDRSRLGLSFLTSADSEMTESTVRLNYHDLCIISDFGIEAFCHLSSNYVFCDANLTIQELKFLHMIATCPKPEIALLQRPCYGSNKSLQNSIRRKLGVDTLFQAVSIASSKNLFDNLPYYSEEVITPFPDLSGWNLEKKATQSP